MPRRRVDSGIRLITAEGVGASAAIEATGRRRLHRPESRREPGLRKATSLLLIHCRNGPLEQTGLDTRTFAVRACELKEAAAVDGEKD
jgi:hypothetical protein